MSGKLLLVDDEVDFAESLGDLLTLEGYEVEISHSGMAALARIRETSFDLVILDMKMPGMNGVECLKGIREVQPGIKAVMLTAFTQGDFIRQAMEAGVLGVLTKGSDVEDLLLFLSSINQGSEVLLVEDDAELAGELLSMLTREGMKVSQARTLHEAREILLKSDPGLLVLDYPLPDGTGRVLLDWLREHQRHINTIVITGYSDQTLADLPSLSLDDILIKPFQPTILLDRIRVKIGAAVDPPQVMPR